MTQIVSCTYVFHQSHHEMPFFIESLQVIRPAYTVSAAWWIFVGWKFPIGDGINQ